MQLKSSIGHYYLTKEKVWSLGKKTFTSYPSDQELIFGIIKELRKLSIKKITKNF